MSRTLLTFTGLNTVTAALRLEAKDRHPETNTSVTRTKNHQSLVIVRGLRLIDEPEPFRCGADSIS